MKITQIVHYYYALLLTIFLTIGGVIIAVSSGNGVFFFLFLPVLFYFISTITNITKGQKITLYYAFILTTIMAIMGFVGASSNPQFFSAILFLPLAIYFWIRILPKRQTKIPVLTETLPEVVMVKTKEKKIPKNTKEIEGEVLAADTFGRNFDLDKRMFLKLIGSTGITFFLFSLFTKKADATFFGSVPGPGTLAIKDSTGTQVDPSIKQPTDGYNISQIDDSSPAYYGFVDKSGNWYIMKEDASNNYRYAKGTTSFSTNWTSRAALTYDYFDVVF